MSKFFKCAVWAWVICPSLSLAKTLPSSPAQIRIVELSQQLSKHLEFEAPTKLQDQLTSDARRLPRLNPGLVGLPWHSELNREMVQRGRVVGQGLADLWSFEPVTSSNITHLLQQILIAQLLEAIGSVPRDDQHDLAVWQSLGVGATSYMIFQQLNPDLVLKLLHRGDLPSVTVMTAGFLAALGLPYATLIGNGVSANFLARDANLALYSAGLAKMQDSVYQVFRQHSFWRALVTATLRHAPLAKREVVENFLREWLGIRRLNSVLISAAIYRHRLNLVSRLIETLKQFHLASENCADALSAGLFAR